MNTVDLVVVFLNAIGIVTSHRSGATGFVPGVLITRGKLLFDRDISHVGDLLHEAGHLAVVPSQFRHLFNDDVDHGVELMFNQCRHLNPDDPLLVNVMQASECEATAWSWAAGVSIRLLQHS